MERNNLNSLTSPKNANSNFIVPDHILYTVVEKKTKQHQRQHIDSTIPVIKEAIETLLIRALQDYANRAGKRAEKAELRAMSRLYTEKYEN